MIDQNQLLNLQAFINNDDADLTHLISPEDLLAPASRSNPARPSTARPSAASSLTPDADGYYAGRAATFATPSDLAQYAKTKDLATGDNGVGFFRGVNTAGNVPYVAISADLLHPQGRPSSTAQYWAEVIAPNGTKRVIEVGDKAPLLKNRRNNAVIELNPAATRLLGSGDANGYRWRLLNPPTP